MKKVGPPRRPRDLRRVVRFIERTKGEATGYVIHCWSGVSRSTAVALGILFLLGRDEDAAVRELLMIRTVASPHPEIVAWFDAELGARLGEALSRSGETRREAIRNRIRARVARGREPPPGTEAGEGGNAADGGAPGTGPS